MEQYRALLEGVLQYERRSFLSVCVIFALALVVLGGIMIFRFRTEPPRNKFLICSFLVVLTVIFAAYSIKHYHYCQDIRHDLEQESFLAYTGEFVHEDYQKDSFYHTVTIYPDFTRSEALRYPDYGNQYSLHSADSLLATGTYYGTVLYGQNSRIVIAWNTKAFEN